MAHDIRILTEAQLRDAVPLDMAAVDCVEAAFAALAGEGVVMPPVLSMELPAANGEVDVKTAYLPGFEGFAIKVSPGFFDNPKLGLASLNGLMILFSAKTGLVEALFLDNGYLTDVRTAAAGAVAARHLAPSVVHTAGVMGTGLQARLQASAAYMVRPFEKLLVWGRDEAKAAQCAGELGKALGVQAQACADPQTLVRESQLVITTTPSREPLIEAEWLHPGLHITAMGSDQAGKNEIAAACLVQADLYCADRLSQTRLMGELRAAIGAGLEERIGRTCELGQVVAGATAGRTGGEEITICDLTGTGAQDTAIATHALQQALLRGAGTLIGS